MIAALVVGATLSAQASPSRLEVLSDSSVVVPGQAFIVTWYCERDDGNKVVDVGSVDVDGADVLSSEGRNAVRSDRWTIVASSILIARRDGEIEIPPRTAVLERGQGRHGADSPIRSDDRDGVAASAKRAGSRSHRSQNEL
jgi:hypothetical protein